MYLQTKTNRIFILLISLLLSLSLIAQNVDEILAEQKKLEQKITGSKSLTEKMENTSRLGIFYNRYKNKQAADSLTKLIFDGAAATEKKQDMFAAFRWAAFCYNQAVLPNLFQGLDSHLFVAQNRHRIYFRPCSLHT